MINKKKIEKCLKMNVMKGSFEGEEGPGSVNVGDSRVLRMPCVHHIECDERVFWEES
jgi:hypothetical protein